MTHDTAKRVTYRFHASGDIDITLLKPWDGEGRLATYPSDVQWLITITDYFVLSLPDRAKIRAARDASPDVFDAVVDDVLCDHADQILNTYSEANRAVLLELATPDDEAIH